MLDYRFQPLHGVAQAAGTCREVQMRHGEVWPFPHGLVSQFVRHFDGGFRFIADFRGPSNLPE
jgi:hypothetical protein